MIERLDGPDLEDEIDHRPIPEIIADICRDLGIAGVPGALRGLFPRPTGPLPWKRRTPADIAALCARADPAPAKPESATPETPERLFRLVAAPNEA